MPDRNRAIELFHPREPGGRETRKRLGEYGFACTIVGRGRPLVWVVDFRHASRRRDERVLHVPEAVAVEMLDKNGYEGLISVLIQSLGR